MRDARTPAIKLFVLATAVLIGCAVDVEVQSPSPVQVGDQVTYEITLTNRTACPLPDFAVNVLPLLDEQEQEAATGELFDELGITLRDLCEAVRTGIPPVINPIARTDDRVVPFLQPASGDPVPLEAATCMQDVDGSTGLTFFQCIVPGLAPGASETASVMVTADTAGTFLSVTGSLARPAGICRGGADAGKVCLSGQQCDSNECADGFCEGGGTPGNGCNSDEDCDGGSCVLCATCPGAGFCSGGSDEPGAVCSEDDDCPSGSCVCGASIVCTETVVFEPEPNGSECDEAVECESLLCEDGVCCEEVCVPDQHCNIQGSEGVCTDLGAPAPAVSSGGMIVAILLLLASGGLGVWRLTARRSGGS